MKWVSFALIVLGIFFTNSSQAVVEGLVLKIHLDNSELMVGEPLSGEIVLENITDETICVENLGGRLTKYLSFRFTGTGNPFAVTVDSIFKGHGDWSFSNFHRKTEFESGGKLREPFFLLTRIRKNWGFTRSSSEFVLGQPGIYSVVARIYARGLENEHKIIGISDPVTVQVNPRGAGFAAYDQEVRRFGLAVFKPLSRCLPSWPSANRGVVSFSDYGPTFDTIVAYQFGPHLRYKMFYNELGPYYSPEQVVEKTRGGLVGDRSLAIRKWRIALLFLMGEPIDDEEALLGNFDVVDFVYSMPTMMKECGINEGR